MAGHGALVIVGSGPGIGSHVAARFARGGFKKVILLSRNLERLSIDAIVVQSAAPGVDVDIVSVELANTNEVRQAMAEVSRRLNGMSLECVVYNASRINRTPPLLLPVEDLQYDMHVAAISMYTVAQWAFPQLLELANAGHHKPSFLVTSGSICQDPFPELFSLSASKAAQYNMVTSLYKAYSEKGIHCGLVVVGGRLRTQTINCNAADVADKTWELYCQPKGQYSKEITLLHPDDEPQMSKQEDPKHLVRTVPREGPAESTHPSSTG